jgi:hypothetical protein
MFRIYMGRFTRLRFGPRRYWRAEYCRVGHLILCTTRVLGNWYWIHSKRGF